MAVEPPTTEEIRRAQAAARQRTIAMRNARAAEALRLIGLMAAEIRAFLGTQAGPDGRIPSAQLAAIHAYLAGRFERFSRQLREWLDAGLEDAVRIGAQLLALTGRIGGNAAFISQVVESLRNFIAADGLQMSDRIWRTDKLTREAVRAAIEGAIARGESASQAAARYLRDGLPVPAPLQAALAGAQAGAIGLAVERALVSGAPGTTAANVNRLLRTEINRAYTESFVAGLAENPDVVGVKFLLSPNHPVKDRCDFYAAVNLHGLGPGVYPLGSHPYPAHPNTLSFLEMVLTHEVTDAHRAGKQTGFEWLRQQSPAEQDLILGGKRKGAAFRNGYLKESELHVPWYRIEARLIAEGTIAPGEDP